jgi:hypothetical protein
VDHARRARFLQVVAEAQATHLPDNIDYRSQPFGVELPDPTGARLDEQLSILEAATTLWEAPGDEASRELLLRSLGAHALRKGFITHLTGMPVQWQVHQYDLHPFGLPFQVIGSPLALASTMAFSQYAYRDESVPARPAHGDVVLDAGGCWATPRCGSRTPPAPRGPFTRSRPHRATAGCSSRTWR